MSASIKKKSKPKSDKVATNNNKQQQTTNNKRPFFLPKINKVFLRPILQNLKGRSVLDKFFFENDPLDEPNQMPPSKKFYLLSKLVKNAKWWSKSSLPLSHSTAKFFPLKKGFKKRQSQLARSPVPVHRIAEQETPVKIESPEEKVFKRKKQLFKKGDCGLKEALRLYRFVNRYNDMEAPGLILELLFTNILISSFEVFRFQ